MIYSTFLTLCIALLWIRTHWNLGFNKLNGTIPEEICALKNLTTLHLNNNALSGSVPSCLPQSITKLVSLDLSENHLSSTILSDIGNSILGNANNLRQLQTLHLGNNDFTGSFHGAISYIESLTEVNISHNNFEGPVIGGASRNKTQNLPMPYYNPMKGLKLLDVSYNKFYGGFSNPNFLARVPNIEKLIVDNNMFTGGIPSELWSLTSLQYFSASHNMFVVVFHQYILKSATRHQQATDLTTFNISHNGFFGSIPTVLGELGLSLDILDLSDNDLTGTIPSELGQCTNLQQLALNNNALSGTIPTELMELSSLGKFF